MQTTKLNSESILPLTCSRSGTCCFGKAVMLNPWELLQFSKEKKVSAKEFRDLYTEHGGIQLLFNGTVDKKGQKACSQYVANFGCSVHLGRPLACRLYPLGRQIQNNKAQYIYEGNQFPCLTDCAEVLELPKLTVGKYLEGQAVEKFEKAQDEYLQVMQNIADIAFELLLDTGLSESGDTKTIALWREMGKEAPEILAKRIGQDWMDALMLPEISSNTKNITNFTHKHNELLQLKAQEQFGTLKTIEECHKASVLIMGVALHLARGLGANQTAMAEHWITIAKQHGAKS